MKIRLLVLTALANAAPSFAQLPSPNATGAALGHIHINVADVDAQTRFWTGVGGQIVQREKVAMVRGH
jgi:catechol-2,3-dioxygenase